MRDHLGSERGRWIVMSCVVVFVAVATLGIAGPRDVLHALTSDGEPTPAWQLEQQQAERPADARAPSATDTRPNVVVILTDDMRSADLRYMPETRRLLKQGGVSFPRAISPHPLCCPARAELLTAEYAQNNHVYTNRPPYGAYRSFDSSRTTAVAMQRSGYLTGFTGKHLNRYGSYDDKPAPLDPGWDYWKPITQGVYTYNQPRFYGQPPETDGYVTTEITDHAVDAIDRFAGPGDPFYLQIDHLAPHARSVEADTKETPPLPEPRYANALSGAQNPSLQNPNYLEADLSDKPSNLQEVSPDLSPSFIQNFFLARIRALKSVDDGVADVVQALKDAGEYDNTYLMFTSDNGFSLGEHQYIGKNRLMSEILSVPLLVSGPGIAPGSSNQDVVTTVDLAATVLRLTQASPRGLLDVDGLSFATNRFTGRPSWRSATLIQAARAARHIGSPNNIWDMRGVMTPRYTYAHRPGHPGLVMLFDHAVDPWELENVAGTRRYALVEKVLARATRILQTCSGIDSCNRWRPRS